MTFKSIKNAKVNQQVIQQIKDCIYQGKLKKGDRLPTVSELHEAWGVSKSSIREAFSALELIGVLRTRTSEGTFIASDGNSASFLEPLFLMLALEENIAQELLEFRMLLECDCIRLAVDKILPDELDEMKKYIEILEESKENEKSRIEADKMFHYAIAKASGNKVIYQGLTLISDTIELHIKDINAKLALDLDTWLKFIQKQDKEIYNAIKEKDSERAIKALRLYIDYFDELINK
jgi:Transcriptional regulators